MKKLHIAYDSENRPIGVFTNKKKAEAQHQGGEEEYGGVKVETISVADYKGETELYYLEYTHYLHDHEEWAFELFTAREAMVERLEKLELINDGKFEIGIVNPETANISDITDGELRKECVGLGNKQSSIIILPVITQ